MSRRYFDLKPRPDAPPQPNYFNPVPADGSVKGIPRPAASDLESLHIGGVLDFVNPAGFGYVKDREHVAGFQSHQFRRRPNLRDFQARPKEGGAAKEKWLDTVKARIAERGYAVRAIKSAGGHYEIKAVDLDGTRVELQVNPKTGGISEAGRILLLARSSVLVVRCQSGKSSKPRH